MQRSERRLFGQCFVACLALAGAAGCGLGQNGDGTPPPSGGLDAGDPFAACGPQLSYSPEADGSCGPGGVTFQMTGSPGVEWWINANRGTNGPATNWLTLYSCNDQTELLLTPTEESTGRDCATCPDSWSLTLGISSWKLPPEGLATSWDGTYFVPGSCGDPVQACVTDTCAAPGRYVAMMCACPPADETPGNCLHPVCVESAFDYPPQNSVVGKLPDTDF